MRNTSGYSRFKLALVLATYQSTFITLIHQSDKIDVIFSKYQILYSILINFGYSILQFK